MRYETATEIAVTAVNAVFIRKISTAHVFSAESIATLIAAHSAASNMAYGDEWLGYLGYKEDTLIKTINSSLYSDAQRSSVIDDLGVKLFKLAAKKDDFGVRKAEAIKNISIKY